MDELSKLERGVDGQRVQQLCSEFLTNIKVRTTFMPVVLILPCSVLLRSPSLAMSMHYTLQAAQSRVAEAVAAPASEREFQPTSYLSMAKAHLASEKVGILSLQIASMQDMLAKQGYTKQPASAQER
jgi:hypothetical protein